MSGSNSSVPSWAQGADKSASGEAEPLGLSVHSMDVRTLDDDPAAQRRTRMGRIKMLLVLAVCAAPVIASYLTYYVIRPGARANYGTLIEPQQPIPAAAQLPLADMSGRSVDPASLKWQWLLIAVAGGDCDARCERQLYTQRQLREMLGKDKARVDRVWLVDDDRPVPEALKPGLTGATVLRVPRAALGAWLKPEPQEELESHLYLVDPLGHWMMRFPAQADPYKVKKDMERLMRASASWDKDGR